MFKKQREWILLLSLFLFIGCSKPMDNNKDDMVVTDPQDTTITEINKEYIPNEELAQEIYEYLLDTEYLNSEYNQCYIDIDSESDSIVLISISKKDYWRELRYKLENEIIHYSTDMSYHIEPIAVFKKNGLIHEVGYTVYLDGVGLAPIEGVYYGFSRKPDNTLKVTHGDPPQGLAEVLAEDALPYWIEYEEEKNKWNDVGADILEIIQQKYLDHPDGFNGEYTINDDPDKDLNGTPINYCIYESCQEKSEEIQKLLRTTSSLSGFNESFDSTEGLMINENVASRFLDNAPRYRDRWNSDELKHLELEDMILFVNTSNNDDYFYIPKEHYKITLDGYMGTTFIRKEDYLETIETVLPGSVFTYSVDDVKYYQNSIYYDDTYELIRIQTYFGDVGHPEDGIPSQYILDYQVDGDIITVHAVRYTRDYTYGPSIVDKYGNTYLFYLDKKEHEVVLENQDKLIHETIVLKDIGEDYYQVLSFTLE